VTKTLKWIPPLVNAELEAIKECLSAAKYIGYPDAILQDVLQSTAALQRFLMDTFHLLLSSLSIQEAEASKKHAHRGNMLTQLAFTYVPLSFVTGIFGMNVKEINGSPLSIWTSVVALIVTSAFTATMFLIYRKWERGRR
jgi:Mg2+ and Co2+ transporter CorA